MSKYKAILEELSKVALNIPAGELSELLKKTDEELTDDEVEAIATRLKKQYASILTTINTTNNREKEKLNEGMRRKAEEFEKALRTSFGVDSEKQGQELIDEIVTHVNSKPDTKGKQLTDDDIKKHPAFIRAESEYKKQLREAQEQAEKSVNDLKADYQRKDVFSKVSKEALARFDEMRPVLSDDPKRAQAQRDLLLEKLGSYDFEEVDGKFIPLKEGRKVENEFGHTLEFPDLVKNTASLYFDFKVAEDRQAPHGSKVPDNVTRKESYNGKLPKTENEWRSMQEDPNIPLKDKIAINQAWEKSQVPA
jgi:hypothetical protein